MDRIFTDDIFEETKSFEKVEETDREIMEHLLYGFDGENAVYSEDEWLALWEGCKRFMTKFPKFIPQV